MSRRRWGRWIGRGFLALLGLFILFVVVVVFDGWRAFGHRAEGARLSRMTGSAQWRGGEFTNPQPLWNDYWGMLGGWASASADGSPKQKLPVVPVGRERFATPPATGLRITWLGHSTILVEIDGHRFLTDPVWGPRSSPLSWLGPRRWYPPPLALEDVPKLDAVILSHDHYDHLDHPTITRMKDWDTTFIVPLGVGAHLVYWGVPESRIVELDWWDRTRVGGIEVVCVPARHASGRTFFDIDSTLWAGYAFLGPAHRAYFSGDTGLFPALRDIGERLGPFDVTMIEAGAYGRHWPDWHLGPEQAVRAHAMVRGRVMLPIHWGLFNLAYHGWTEPIERVLAAAKADGATLLVPRPGQSIEPQAPPPFERWWPDLPWKTAAEDPIVATKME